MANSSAPARTEVSDGHKTVVIGAADDPTRHRRIADLELENQELRSSLFQSEILMRETNHRVKNNLQMVSSLLRMQAELLRDCHAVAALRATQHRVLSMAMIHERLCGDPRLDVIDFEDYARVLVNELFDSYTVQGAHVTKHLSCSQVFLKVEQAIPCSLILNELVTNSLKYAYPNGAKGEVRISLHETLAGLVTLVVSDDGAGLPGTLNWKDSSSMGLPIVDLLAKQIGAKLTVTTRPGTEFRLEFQQ